MEPSKELSVCFQDNGVATKQRGAGLAGDRQGLLRLHKEPTWGPIGAWPPGLGELHPGLSLR